MYNNKPSIWPDILSITSIVVNLAAAIFALICLYIITNNIQSMAHTAKELQAVQSRDNMEYQLTLDMDSIRVWDGNRYVGAVANGNSAMDSLFIHDNE